MKLCKCGCGKSVTKELNNYIVGHWMRGKTSWNKGKSWPKTIKDKFSQSAIKKFKDRPDLRKKCGYNKLTYKRLKDKYKFFCEIEEIQEDENGDVLVKCKFCSKFFIPTYTQLQERIRYIKNSAKNIHQYFYCSPECKKLCKYYNRHVDIDNYDLDKLREYSNLVRIETERTVKNHSNKIKNIELRGKKKGYDLDHKYSVVEGFKNNVDPLIISHYKNLEVVTWKENSNKKSKCSLTLKELYFLVNKDQS